MINGAALLISDLQVKQNVYDGTNLFRVTYIRDLLEMSQDYVETTGTSEYFHLDTTDTTAMAVNTMANWLAHNRGCLNRHRLITGAAEVKSIIPLNKFTYFDGLRTNILPPSQIQLEFGLTHDNNLIYRENGVDPGRVVVTRFMLWIPKMIFNSEGLSYAMKTHTKTMWTYHREMVLESVSSQWQESTFTAGVKKKNKHIFVYLQRTNKTLNQEENPHIFDTFKINAADDNCYLQSERMKVGNGIYYPESEYSYDNMARIYRDVISYTGKQNDKNTWPLLNRENFQSLFGFVHFNLTHSDDALQSSDPKKLILRYRLSQASGNDYKVYAIILYDEEVKVDIVGNETVII